jgi:hydroxyacylglutathione hydrolase
MEGADEARILLTHGHGDHAGSVPALVDATGAEVLGPEGVDAYGVERLDAVVRDGDVIVSDAGALRAVHTPGHTPEHLCFHWEEQGALFAGDLVLGEGDTTWVAEYPGCVADYLETIDRMRRLDLRIVYPAHGPPLADPADTWNRFEGHRRERIEQVRRAMAEAPGAELNELLDIVYGDRLPEAMRGPAGRSLSALVEYVREG